MSNWKLHTPNGVNDILPDECAVKKEIESTIWSVFLQSVTKKLKHLHLNITTVI